MSLLDKSKENSSEVTFGGKTLRKRNQEHPSFNLYSSDPRERKMPYHKLAAIMVTDIVGYTDIIEENEEWALKLLAENRRVQRIIIECQKGRWIKEIGDGILSSFNTASEAVQCALEIQKAAQSIPDLKLHIGIHLSQVIFVNGDVFGLGVNIAFRIQELAGPGKIWVSGSVAEKAFDKKEVGTRLVARSKLKHVKELVRIYEVNGVSLNEDPGSLPNGK